MTAHRLLQISKIYVKHFRIFNVCSQQTICDCVFCRRLCFNFWLFRKSKVIKWNSKFWFFLRFCIWPLVEFFHFAALCYRNTVDGFVRSHIKLKWTHSVHGCMETVQSNRFVWLFSGFIIFVGFCVWSQHWPPFLFCMYSLAGLFFFSFDSYKNFQS